MQRYLFSLFCLLAVSVFPALAGGMPSRETATAPVQSTAYMFGISQNLADTIVYMSEVCEVKGVQWGKHKFLSQRGEYAEQFRAYVARTQQSPFQTAAIVFAPTRQKAEKELVKTFKKLNEQKMPGRKLIVRMVPRSEFQFRLPRMAR
ncbi:MAG: hypothetical protein Q4D66_07230 [Bacteroidales bacterium]|nr:hypothetical protein [Bacteroidales bacterium]